MTAGRSISPPPGQALLPKRGMEVGSRDHGGRGESESILLLVDHLREGSEVRKERQQGGGDLPRERDPGRS